MEAVITLQKLTQPNLILQKFNFTVTNEHYFKKFIVRWCKLLRGENISSYALIYYYYDSWREVRLLFGLKNWVDTPIENKQVFDVLTTLLSTIRMRYNNNKAKLSFPSPYLFLFNEEKNILWDGGSF